MKYVMIISLLITGCMGNQITNPPSSTKVEIPANLKDECPPIPEWKDRTFGAIVSHDVELMGEYSKCRNKHKELVDGIQKQK